MGTSNYIDEFKRDAVQQIWAMIPARLTSRATRLSETR